MLEGSWGLVPCEEPLHTPLAEEAGWGVRLRGILGWASLILGSDPFRLKPKREHLRGGVEPRGLWGSRVEVEIQGTQRVRRVQGVLSPEVSECCSRHHPGQPVWRRDLDVVIPRS